MRQVRRLRDRGRAHESVSASSGSASAATDTSRERGANVGAAPAPGGASGLHNRTLRGSGRPAVAFMSGEQSFHALVRAMPCLLLVYSLFYLLLNRYFILIFEKWPPARGHPFIESVLATSYEVLCVCVCVCAWLCVAVCVCVYTYVLLVFLIFFLAGGLLLMFQSLLELVAPSVTTGGGVQECAVPTGHAPWWMCT